MQRGLSVSDNGGKIAGQQCALRYNTVMVKHRDERPLFSLLLQVANPALIIAMVASLIFFLIEIFYRGPHVFRLNVIMTLFTIATVLISRISIEAGKERAAVFAAGLALATLATTSVIVDFEYENLAMLEPVVIIFLIATVMWVSNRLVWDCTLLGRKRDVSAMGLLEAIRQKIVPGATGVDRKHSPRASKSGNKGFDVFEFMLGRNGKNTTPGLWVFYLAVAAFPIFGAGQWFVNPNSTGFSIFFLFAVYLTSGLGLLMVTSLLGLKRYANKRGVSIPEPVAMNWLFVGTIFLVGLLLMISLLPRPDLSSTMNDYLVLLGSEKRTSELALGEDNDPQDQPDANQNAKPKLKPNNEPGDDRPPEDAPVADGKRGDQTDPNSSEKKNGGGGEKSNSKSDKGSRENQNSDESKQGQGEGGEKSDQRKQGKEDKGDVAEDAERKNGDGDEADQAQGKPKPNGEAGEQPEARPNKVEKLEGPEVQPPRLTSQPDAKSLRWILYSLVGLMLMAIGIMYRAELLRIWQQLFATQKRKDDDESDNTTASGVVAARQIPFSSFTDPFVSGMAKKVRPEKLMEYSLDAMRAWANERGVDVSGHGTVDDLVAAIEASIGESQSEFKSFAVAFNRTIYGDLRPSSSDLKTVAQIWRFMKTNSGKGVSPRLPQSVQS